MKEIYIALRNDGVSGDGSVGNPFDGSTDDKLDEILSNPRKVAADTTIHLGPGLFQTKGFGGLNSLWFVRSGQRIVGSGIFSTTLQLVKGRPPSGPGATAPLAVIGGSGVRNVEISDLTVDANLARQPKRSTGPDAFEPPLIKVDGITLYNAVNVLVSRVRVINWGTYTPPDIPGSHEGFPVYIEGGYAPNAIGNNTIEDCIAELPDLSPAREISALTAHSYFAAPGVLCTLRNNYINGDFSTGLPPAPVEVSDLEGEEIIYDSEKGIVAVKTLWPHRLEVRPDLPPEEVIIAGASVPEYNGRWKVRSVPDERTFTFLKTDLPAPPPAAGMTVQRYVPQALPITAISHIGSTVTITTPAPHFRTVGDFVRISGLRVNGTAENLFNGSFPVVAVTTNTLSYAAKPTPPGGQLPNVGEAWLDRWRSQHIIIPPKGLDWQGDGTNGYALISTEMPHFKIPGDSVLIEEPGGDPLWNGYFQVTQWLSSRQFKCRLRSRKEPARALGDRSRIVHKLQAMTATTGYGGRVFGNRIVDVYTGGPYHDLNVGSTTPERDLTIWNNYYHFVYVGPFSNVHEAARGEDYRQWWNTARDNLVDLQPYASGSRNIAGPGGILFVGPYHLHGPGWPAFMMLIARDNIIRFADGASSPGSVTQGHAHFGISTQCAIDALVEDNLILFPQNLYFITTPNSGSVRLCNNTGTDGKVLSPPCPPETVKAGIPK